MTTSGAWDNVVVGKTTIASSAIAPVNFTLPATSITPAAAGTNSDITSLTALATPLSPGQGGTGLSAPGASGNVLTSNGIGAWTSSVPATNGTVTNVSSGNATPLFTVGVANPTTTPTFTFTQSTAAANTAFGNFTGGIAAPTFTIASTVRTSLGVAASGANSDITSLSALTTLVATGSATYVVAINNAPVITVPGGVAGNIFWSMPEQGSGYKKVVIALVGYNDVVGTTITFPVVFAHTPSVFIGNGLVITIATPSTTQVVIPAAAGLTGVVTVEGI